MSSKSVDNKEGDLQACQRADTEAPKAPGNCGAPLRLQLVALGVAVDPKAPPKEVACPKGTVAFNGACIVPAPDTPTECKGDSLDACVRQCDAGNTASCGKMYLDALLKSLENNAGDKTVAHLQQKGCELGDLFMCAQMAESHVTGMYGFPKDPRKAAELFGKACKAGEGSACHGLGKMAPPDQNTALLFARGCDAGHAPSCVAVAEQLERGLGIPANPALAKKAIQRGCSIDPGVGGGCKAH